MTYDCIVRVDALAEIGRQTRPRKYNPTTNSNACLRLRQRRGPELKGAS